MSVEFTASPYFTQASETGRDGHTVETFRILVEEFDDLQMFATGARLRAGRLQTAIKINPDARRRTLESRGSLRVSARRCL